jgi:hypothetical protein
MNGVTAIAATSIRPIAQSGGRPPAGAGVRAEKFGDARQPNQNLFPCVTDAREGWRNQPGRRRKEVRTPFPQRAPGAATGHPRATSHVRLAASGPQRTGDGDTRGARMVTRPDALVTAPPPGGAVHVWFSRGRRTVSA